MSYIHVQNAALRAALISNFMVAELLASRAGKDYTLWLIAPWIKDFVLHLPPESDLSMLLDTSEPCPRLFEALRQIAANGGRVALVVRPEHEPARVAQFIQPLCDLAAAEPAIVVRRLDNLHAKIYAGQCGGLYGSPNLTASGAAYNVEFSRYVSDTRTVAQLRAEAQALFEQAKELRR